MEKIMRLNAGVRHCAWSLLYALLTFSLMAASISAGTESYGYDALGRLVTVTHAEKSTESYTYDAAGNRTQTVKYSPAPTATLSAGQSSVLYGAATTLNWTNINATSASIDNGLGSVSPVAAGSITVSPKATTTYTLTSSGPGGSATQSTKITVLFAPSGSFSASAILITAGNSVTLSWTASDATSASIDNGVGVVSASSGSVTVAPVATTTYTLTLTGAGGTTAKTVTVNVVAAASGSLSADPVTVTSGASSKLSWTTSNATSASIDNGVGAVSTAGGSATVTPSVTTTYTLSVANSAGDAVSKTAKVTVVGSPAGTFMAGTGTITSGNSVTLSWTCENTVSASIDNGVGAVNASGGSVTVRPASTTTYTLTLVNAAGTAVTRTVAIIVVAAPSGSLNASAATITSGNAAALTWSASNAVSATLNGSAVSASGGSMSVSPASTATYTLTVTNAAGTSASYAVTVTVVAAPSGSLTAAATTINYGNSTTLAWSASNAVSATLNGGAVSASGGSMLVSPTSTATYTLVVVNAAGTTASYTATVTVNHIPCAANDSVSTYQNTAVTISPLGNDSDADGDSMTVSAVGTPSYGSVVNNGATLTYTPASGYNGSDSFGYTASDGRGGTASATIGVTVVNRAPTANNITAKTSCVTYSGVSMKVCHAYINLASYVSDPDGDTLSVTAFTGGSYSDVYRRRA